jgi:ABC-2 type transport system permease protein
LYYLNQIFWSVSFWIHVTWSVITIKDALLMLFSGVLFPIWFMPQPVRSLMRYTPFESIYYLPISIYTGKLDACGVAQALLLQVLWGGGLYLLGRLLWNRGLQRISIQGG